MTSEFIQTGPAITNTWESDRLLRAYLERVLPPDCFAAIAADLKRFGERAAMELPALAEEAEANPPTLRKFDAWGNRIDEVVTSHAWKMLDRVSAEEGIVAIGYERQYGAFSRLYQFAKLYLFHPSSAYYTCPLAMTDGAAKLIEVHGDADLKRDVFSKLTSRDPGRFWTSGQWMTERAGGSDVGGSETLASPAGNQWRLTGTKWFTSAITSQMAMTLGRIADEKGKTVDGSRGLSLFQVPLVDEGRDSFEILRLKDKLGTRALPTAEVRLTNMPAVLVGRRGEGVKTIATLFNVTRLYNACTTMGAWRRLLDLAIDYAGKRYAFDKPIRDHALHYRMLSEIEIDFQAGFHLVMYIAQLLGREETSEGSEEESRLLRLLTPIAKLYCAKRNLLATTELLESFGGAGYLEDTGLPRWLRDNQVLTIWEGTTNVLSLDVLRAIAREDALPAFFADIEGRLRGLPASDSRARVSNELDRLKQHAAGFGELSPEEAEYGARDLAFSLGDIMSASLLLEHACALPGDDRAAFVAERFCNRPLFGVTIADSQERARRRSLIVA